MRVAITGASGLLGRALIAQAGSEFAIVAATHSTVIQTTHSPITIPLDLSDPASIRRFVAECKADILIHAAAITDVDRCEREPELAHKINADATQALVDATRGTAIRIVFISTDYVFDGVSGPYKEDDQTNPINVYGASKLAGEQIVLSAGDQHSVVRSASFLGCGSPTKPTFVDRMLETMRHHPPLRAAYDQLSNVTPVKDLATGIWSLIHAAKTGVWHIAHPDIISRYDLALLLAKSCGLPSSVIERVEYKSLMRAANRPLRGGLNTDKSKSTLPQFDRPLQESVDLTVQQILSSPH